MMEEIKACPYCGSDNISITSTWGKYFGTCDGCGANGPEANSYTDAILLWNAAANQLGAKDAEIARLTEACDDMQGEYLRMKDERNEAKAEIDELKAEHELLRQQYTCFKNVAWRTAEIGYTNMRNERDEARRVARVLYNERNAMSLGLDTIKRHVEKSIHDGVPITRLSILGICKAGLENLSYTRDEPPTSRVDATESDA